VKTMKDELKAIEDALAAADYELTEEDLRAIDEGLADARAGRFASDEEIKALFDRYRGA
jgi:predicted transcriptional regulator